MSEARKELRVLARPAFSNRTANPYNARIYGPLAAHGIEVVEFAQPRAAWTRADLVHVHWPESTFNHGLLGAKLTTEALLFTLRRHKARGARIVWTAHNLAAHERRHVAAEEAFWARYLPLLDAIIALSPSALERVRERRPRLRDLPAYVIPHPDYRGEYPDTLSRAEARRRLELPLDARVITFFGHIKAYKNAPALIEAVRALPDVHLLVAGKPRDAELEAEVRAAAKDAPNIHLHLGFVPVEDTQVYLRACDLLALPYRDISSSGSALLGLSFDRPVWLTEGPLATELAAWTPPGWVTSGTLSPEEMQRALEVSAAAKESPNHPQIARFEPAEVARLHAEAFRAIVSFPPSRTS